MVNLRLTHVNLGTDDPARLARFYAQLFGWRIERADPEFQVVDDPAGGVGVSCQYEADHARPVWPAGADDQQMQLHLEVRVDDLAGAVQHALDCGATLAEFQPQDDVRVCLDPAGHPFCLYL
ncbi:MAG TPA: VOC family protein [Jatrophihabitans sp.]|nr:VOC family protein [Jatrophihabitans sp.]